MYYIKHISVLLVAATAILPLAAQSLQSNVRMDTTRTTKRDAQGNIVMQSFELRVEGDFAPLEGSFESRKDQIKIRKITYFSNRIGLTSREAERFWPVYNEYDEKLARLKREQRRVLNQLSNYETMNEKEVKALLDAYVNSRVQESALLQEYHKKFSTILSPSKVVRLYLAEEEFKQWLIELLRYGR